VWFPSNNKNVEWFDIYLIPSEGDWIPVKYGASKDATSYSWKVPDNLAPGTYTIRIYAAAPKFMQGKFGNWISFEEAPIRIVD